MEVERDGKLSPLAAVCSLVFLLKITTWFNFLGKFSRVALRVFRRQDNIPMSMDNVAYQIINKNYRFSPRLGC